MTDTLENLNKEPGDFGVFDFFGGLIKDAKEIAVDFGKAYSEIEISKLVNKQKEDPNVLSTSKQVSSAPLKDVAGVDQKTLIIAGAATIGVVALFLLVGGRK